MNAIQKLIFALAGVVLALVSASSAMAYGVGYPYEYGQPRIGAYSANVAGMGYAQGFYDYVSPPVALTRYGEDYFISNIRESVYPNYPYTYLPTMQRPYFGYPYGIDRTPYTTYSSFGGAGGFGY